MKKKDYSSLILSKHNMLTILSELSKRKRTYLNCLCDCWRTKDIQACDVISGKTKSCGCYNKKSAKERWYKHKLSWHKLYKLYYDILSRCNNKSKRSYKDYWARWIKIERETFEEFYNDMIDLYNTAILDYKIPSIERIDVNWNYCKENCIFIENSEQSKNRRTNYNIEWLNLSDYCKKNNLKMTTMYSRFYRQKIKTMQNKAE